MEHLVEGCKVLANGEYLSRHNRALMILAIAWAKEHDLVGQDVVCTRSDGSEEQS